MGVGNVKGNVILVPVEVWFGLVGQSQAMQGSSPCPTSIHKGVGKPERR